VIVELADLLGRLILFGLGALFTALALARMARRGREHPAPVSVSAWALLCAALVFLLAQTGLTYLLPDPENPAHPWVLARILFALLASLLTLFILCGIPRWFLPLAERRPMRFALKAYAAGLPVLLGFYFLYIKLLGYAGLEFEHEILTGFSSLAAPERALSLVFVILLVPILEEAFFRGFLFSGLAADPRFGPFRALLFSSLVFGLAHPPLMWLPGIGLGCLFAWAHWRVGDLRAPILMHVIHNGLVCVWMLS
jgi:membrane protease YdiL (CAAX protease family)